MHCATVALIPDPIFPVLFLLLWFLGPPALSCSVMTSVKIERNVHYTDYTFPRH